MRVLTQLVFAHGTIDGALLARLLRAHDLGFEPTRIASDGFDETRYDEPALRRIAGGTRLRWARVTAGDAGSLRLTGIASRPVQQLLWELPEPPERLSLVDEVSALPGFTAGYMGDADDVYWQSETSIAAYDAAGRAHDRLPKRSGGMFPGEEQIIDISANPGRRVPFDGMVLGAAATMWFGNRAFAHLDRSRVASSPVGSVSETPGGVLRVDLFPLHWYADRIAAVRERQRRFREAAGFDELERSGDTVDAASADPFLDVETGHFPHGGVRRLTEYLDADGSRAVPRSEAERRRSVELAADGSIVARGEGPMPAC